MATATKSGQSLSFTYNADGLRTTKTVNGVVHTYYYSGSKLVRETYGDYVLDFFYDQNGTPFMLLQNGNIYYYITNAQGDVIRLVDINGNTAASYRYDPYGKAISALGSHATINPLRYRGYVFDHETGLYYLQSRYYDPEIGRFINADAFASTGQGLLGNNMFAYCLNSPINLVDYAGYASIWYYLSQYSDWGYIHRMVQNHIQEHYGMRTEVTLDTYGRADIMNAVGAVWEIKHAGSTPEARSVEAFAQAFSYVLINNDAKTLGSALSFNGFFYIRCGNGSYLVTYYTPMPGVVLYTVTTVDNYNGAYYCIYVPNENTAKKRQEFERQLSAGLAIGGVVVLGGPVFNNPRASVDPRGDLAII